MNGNERERGKMKAVIGVVLFVGLHGVGAWAQTEPAAAKASSNPSTNVVQTFYLGNVGQGNELNDIIVALRNVVVSDPSDRIYLLASQNTILVRASPEHLATVQRLVKEFDRPKKSYRLTYTFTEMDEGKRVGSQHYSVTVVSGTKTTLRIGSKAPIATSQPATMHSSDVNYVDVGLNVDASVDESANGARLRSKVERTSVAEDKSGVGMQDPVIRQAVLEGTTNLVMGKQTTLGTLDIPGSARHLDIEVVSELVP